MLMRQKIPTLAWVLVAACSSPAQKPQTAHAPAVPVVAATPPRPAHQCMRSVYPTYRSAEEVAAEAAEQAAYEAAGGSGTEGADENSDAGGAGEGGGWTLSEKAAELAKSTPMQGVCDTRHRSELETALLRLPARAGETPIKTRPWDHKSPVAHQREVGAALALSAVERDQLLRDGVVVPARLTYSDYTRAYYDIHRAQLPVYISVDSIFHAVYASHDALLAKVESEGLVQRFDAALGAMHCGLVAAAAEYPADTAHDLDLYLTVARSLLANTLVPSELGGDTDAQAERLVSLITEASGVTTISLFGRDRAFDATLFVPRGHYASDGFPGASLEAYFRTAMWLSRVEFNLVSRDTRSSSPGYVPDRSETPREAVAALALADLVQRSGASNDIAAIDQAWTSLAGRREDITVAELAKLRGQAGIARLMDPDAAAKLRAAIGEGWQRTVNVHPSPTVPRLAAITTLIGPRISPDTAALGALTAERGQDHVAAEVGFMLGHDRAQQYAAPKALHAMRGARSVLNQAPRTNDLYTAWLDAIRALGERQAGSTPSFMDGAAYADMRLNSALAAYGQLRHNHVLTEPAVYDVGGCEIPDGYVEPAVNSYLALAAYAVRGKHVFEALDPAGKLGGAAHFAKVERLMNVLVALSREELAGRPLSDAAKRFLAMVVEQRDAEAMSYSGSIPVATYDGWYLDLFPDVDTALQASSFIVDYATYDRNGEQGVNYLGAKGPRLGVFVIDSGGAPRLMVGPVAQAFGYQGPLEKRLTDADVETVTATAAWSASFTSAAPPEPELTVTYERPNVKRRGRPGPRLPATRPTAARGTPRANTIQLESPAALGPITVELLDHHFVRMTTLNATLVDGKAVVTVPKTPRVVEAIRVRVDGFVGRVDTDLQGRVDHTFGDIPAPSAHD